MSEDRTLSTAERRAISSLLDLNREGDLYGLLGVSPEAERREIREAYYERSRQWHPDRFFQRDLGDQAEALETVFVAITNAYRRLTNPKTRSEYDRSLRTRGNRKRSSARPQAAPAAEQRPAQAHEVRLENRTLRPQVSETAEPEPELPPEPAPTVPPRRRRAERKPRQRQGRYRQSPAMRKLRDQIKNRMKQARKHYEQGKTDFEAGDVVKAMSSLHLATRFEPQNPRYKALFEEARTEARKIQATSFITAAENAESFAKYREAIAHYRKAVDYGTEDSRPYYRLGLLVQRIEEDPRSALQYMRRAVELDRTNIDYRLSLGKLFTELGLGLNARREFEAILRMDKNHTEAKEGLKRVR